MTYLTVPLSTAHKRELFSCGKDLLDNYFHKQVGQDLRRKLAVCFIIANDENKVKGYYTLSSDSIPLDCLPDKIKKLMLRSYRNLPTTLLGRLAVDQQFKGQGLGKKLLIDALSRAYEISGTIGSMAVIVDPLDTDAEAFYLGYGFIKLPESGRMFLPMKTIGELFKLRK